MIQYPYNSDSMLMDMISNESRRLAYGMPYGTSYGTRPMQPFNYNCNAPYNSGRNSSVKQWLGVAAGILGVCAIWKGGGKVLGGISKIFSGIGKLFKKP